MNGIECFLVFMMVCAPEEQKALQRKDSVTVSAGISKEQLASEQRLNDVLTMGDQARRSGNYAVAIRQFERARDMVRSDKLLAEQQDRVLDKLGQAYLGGGRASDAVAAYTALLELRHDDCQPASDSPSQCAEAKQSLGYSKMLSGDFQGALPILQDAEASFGTAAKPDDPEEYRTIETKKQGETRVLISAALFRLAKRQEAVAAIKSAIQQLKKVESNTNVQQSIRDSAADSRQKAEKQLELIER